MELPVVTVEVGQSLAQSFKDSLEREAFDKATLDRVGSDNPVIKCIIDGALRAMDDLGEGRLTLETAKNYVRTSALTVYAALEAQAAAETAE